MGSQGLVSPSGYSYREIENKAAHQPRGKRMVVFFLLSKSSRGKQQTTVGPSVSVSASLLCFPNLHSFFPALSDRTEHRKKAGISVVLIGAEDIRTKLRNT